MYKVEIAQLIGKRIFLRDQLILIDEAVKNIAAYPIALNFSGVEFISASFAQALLAYVRGLDDKILIENFDTEPQELINIIKVRKKKPFTTLYKRAPQVIG